MADIFLSYRRKDRERVVAIENKLRDAGFSVWFDARLDAGEGGGFDAEIERELASAFAVIACWSKEATKSIYVRAESKRGLERNILIPTFIEVCELPIPFNAIDTIDLSDWVGQDEHTGWDRLLTKAKRLKQQGLLNQKEMAERSKVKFAAVEEQIFPGTLALLSRKVAAIHELDAGRYQADVTALLEWMSSMFSKEYSYTNKGYETAERQPGHSSGPWAYWNSGDASARAKEIAQLEGALNAILEVLSQSKEVLQRPTP